MALPEPPSAHAAAVRYCGREFPAGHIERIRELIASEPESNRARLSRRVCELLDWRRGDGRLKDMSCRVAMLRMARDGLIELPPPEKGNGNGRNRPRITSASDPREPVTLESRELRAIVLTPVVRADDDSPLWNELVERYHYLGYKPLPGEQIRYLVRSGDSVVAALGFGAAAWKVAPRDRFRGTSYRAANWIHVGATQGRAKLDTHTRFPVPVKDVFLYPLHKHFRRELCAAVP